MNMFKKDSLVLAEKGQWELVIYANRAVSLLSKDGSEIRSLVCCKMVNDDGTISDEGMLIDKLGDLYLEQVKKNAELRKQLSSNDKRTHEVE